MSNRYRSESENHGARFGKALPLFALLMAVLLLAGCVAPEAPTEAPTTGTAATETPAPTPTEPVPEETQPSDVPTEPTQPPTEAYVPDPRLEAAIAMNKDVFALLSFGEGVELFVTQCGDNSFYLEHDYTGASSWNGAAFLDYRCVRDPRDDNLLIHGHNMKDFKIFGTLTYYYDADYLAHHPVFSLSMRNTTELYVPYAVVDVEIDEESPDYFKLDRTVFFSDKEFDAYTGYLSEHSLYEIPVRVSRGDALLTLVTCNYKGSNGRMAVCLRRLHSDETAEQYETLFREAFCTE